MASFTKNDMFEYNEKSKLLEGIIKITLIVFLVVIISLYFFNLFEGTFIQTIFDFIKNQFSAKSLLGAFFIGALGGLFFLSVPIEILFINALRSLSYNPFLIGALLFAGLFLSYVIDYALGRLLSRFATKLISSKQFYSIKVKLNTYGPGLVFLFNALPLPSQPLTFICGVFKYNKYRYFLIWTLAWILKIVILILFYPYIMKIIGVLVRLF